MVLTVSFLPFGSKIVLKMKIERINTLYTKYFALKIYYIIQTIDMAFWYQCYFVSVFYCR